MERIVIIGSSGAGKTALAKKLSTIFKITILKKTKIYHLDRIFWGRGWKRITREDRINISQNLVLQRRRWIIEGNYPESSELCLEASDTIIFLDLSPIICLIRVVNRHYKELLPRHDLPMECVDRLSLRLIMRVLFFRFTRRSAVMQKLHHYKDEGKEVVILHTAQAVEDFVAQLQTLVYDEENVPNLVSVG